MTLSSALLAISRSSESGVFQISGAHDVSYYEAALHLASRLDVERQRVTEARASENGVLPEEIIRYSSLETSRIGALTGWKAPDPYSVIDEVFRERIEAYGGHFRRPILGRSGVLHEINRLHNYSH